MNLDGKRVYVAGHRGMVGSAVARKLAEYDCELLTATRSDLDLSDAPQVSGWFGDQRPQVVIIAAAVVGGILANDTHPVQFLGDNLAIELNLITAAHNAGVEKLVFLGSSCIYPKYAAQPISESELLTGALEPTNEWYAIAKIAGIKLCQAYRRQYGDDYISIMPCNLYGPEDNFDLTSSHVVPALIRKAHEAKLAGTDLTVWGSGAPRREFLYADDAADAILFATKHYSEEEHLNAGFGSDVTIAELAKLVTEVVGFEGKIRFDSSKPDGTPRKLMDSSRLNALGWTPRVHLREGLRLSYEWYLANTDL